MTKQRKRYNADFKPLIIVHLPQCFMRTTAYQHNDCSPSYTKRFSVLTIGVTIIITLIRPLPESDNFQVSSSQPGKAVTQSYITTHVSQDVRGNNNIANVNIGNTKNTNANTAKIKMPTDKAL